MSSVRPFAEGVLADLRARGLLPVAILLIVAVLAVPLLFSRSVDPVAVAPEPEAPAESADTGVLPGPEEALSQRPLVTLATLDRSSDLGSFRARDPFKPLQKIETLDGTQEADVTSLATAPVAGASLAPIDQLSFGGGSGGSSSGGGVTSPPAPVDTAPSPAPVPEPITDPAPAPKPERSFTYAVDLKFDGPETSRRKYVDLPRLAMLPLMADPRLIFLGVSEGGDEAVFLVDASLRASAEGEGICRPSPQDCATVALGKGELQTFLDESDGRYLIQIDRIHKVPIAEAQQSAHAAAESPEAGIGEPVRRFLPVLTELVVSGGRG